MKKVLAFTLALVLVSVGVSFADVFGSKHDLTPAGGYTGATMSTCQYCHTPHLRNSPPGSAPLWNRTVGPDGSWTLYGTTRGGTAVGNPGSNSKACLSCHDGTIAVGSVLLGNPDIITKTNVLDADGKIISAANLGVDLANEHPIGFPFFPNRGGVPAINEPFKLYSGSFECGSCHDPHDTTNAAFLRTATASICSDCHSAI